MFFRIARSYGLFSVVRLGLISCLVTVNAWAQPAAPSSSQPSSQPTQNRPAQKTTNADESAVFERILNRIRFENDGTEVSETEAVVRIQSQAGVEEFGQLVFGYSSATEKLQVEYVRARKPDGIRLWWRAG